MTDKHIQFIIYQLLLGLQYMHSANVVHRDIKPENILINSDCHIKICDMGMSRAIDFEEDPTMSTNYVVTRYYRAPELLLNSDEISRAMDVWSAGCVFAELLGRTTLFAGDSPIDQLISILKILGTPQQSDIKGSEEGISFINKQKKYVAVPFRELFPNASADTLDLLAKMLIFNHELRITAAEALKHPCFDDIYGCNIGGTDTDGLYMAKSKFDFSFEDSLIDSETIKKVTFDTIANFHKYVNTYRPRKKELEKLVTELKEEIRKKEVENSELSRQVAILKKIHRDTNDNRNFLSYQLSASPRTSVIKKTSKQCCFQ
jgi:serine/threonine protein kinase